jgi:hypothetical protein
MMRVAHQYSHGIFFLHQGDSTQYLVKKVGIEEVN